ncbi:hypothetical protein R1sor_005633 [Riccia sorocarpa]|uniref:Dirigent protein n=1 Tax=Riccia sorocarpa TaxID=122646 RepID=A0ABD3HKD9_9MARC
MGSPKFAAPVALFLTLGLLCTVIRAPAVRADKQWDPSLVIYLFEQFFDVPGANSTDLIVAPPGGTLSWGSLGVADFPVRLSADPSAPVIGNSPAVFYAKKGPGLPGLGIYKLITLETPKYKGTIFSAGDFTNPTGDPSWEEEFTVSGGTGSFRGAGGYIRVTLVDSAKDKATYKNLSFPTSRLSLIIRAFSVWSTSLCVSD